MARIMTTLAGLLLSFNLTAVELVEIERGVDQAAKQAHPRLIFTAAVEARLRKRVAAEPLAAHTLKTLQAFADELIDKPACERVMIGRRLLSTSREVYRRVTVLAVVYRLTGENKYLQRAEREMLAAAAFKDWNPSHYLDTAELCMALALGYDWLHDDLPAASREKIRAALKTFGFGTYKVNTGANNWNDVCNSSLLVAALALADTDREAAVKIVHDAVNALPLAFKQYSTNGAHPESVTYWAYATRFSCVGLAAMDSACGGDFGLLERFPAYLRSIEYYTHLHGPTGLYVNYSDAGSGHTEVAAQTFWFAAKVGQPGYANRCLAQMQARQPGQGVEQSAAFGLIWLPEKVAVMEPPPTFYQADGVTPIATHRSGWNDANAGFISLKGGQSNANHAHMDGGSFVFEADGERWAIDLGMQKYESLEKHGLKLWDMRQDGERWTVFRLNNFSHNTLVVNEHLQRVEGKAVFIGKTATQSVLDMTALYAGDLQKAWRGVQLMADRRALVQDDLIAKQAATVRWGLVTRARPKIEGATVVLSAGDKTLTLTRLAPTEGAAWEIYPTDPPPGKLDAANEGTCMVGFKVQVAADQAVRLAVLLTPGSVGAAAPPKLQPLTADAE